MIAAILALAAAPVPGASVIYSPPFPPTTGGTSGFLRPSRDALDLEYESKAIALRAEMHTLKESDGGKLSAEHRAYLKERADSLLTTYRRDLERVDRNDPAVVNADGSPSK